MDTIAIHPLEHIEADHLRKLVGGYTSRERFTVTKTETVSSITLNLDLQPLDQPYRKQWPVDANYVDSCQCRIKDGFSLGVFRGKELLGLAIGEKHSWNRSLWVWEFHIHQDYRRQGWGRKLMESVAQMAKQAGCRVLVCETQNTNVPAIRFYRSLGFEIGAVDLSYYTNRDLTDFEVAVFMKRYLQP